MFKITLKDNSQIEFSEAKTVMEIAESIFRYKDLSFTAAGNTNGIDFEKMVNNIFI